MTNRLSFAIGCLSLSAAALLSVSASAEPPALPACIEVSQEVRYRGIGYDHVVHLASSCTTVASCSVASDVAPDPVQVAVPAGAQVEVVTMRGSPAREFKPRVSCNLVL